MVRSVSVYLLAARRVGDADAFRHALGDVDHRVRIEAVRALVSIDDADGVAAATRDGNREVRIVAANGLATLRSGHDAVRELVADTDPLVRAAALTALGQLGCSEVDFAAVEQALRAPAWQVREGAARALSGAAAEHRGTAAVADAGRRAPRRAQSRGAQPQPLGGDRRRGPGCAQRGTQRRRRRRAGVRASCIRSLNRVGVARLTAHGVFGERDRHPGCR